MSTTKHFTRSNKAFTPANKAARVNSSPREYTGSNNLVVCNGVVMSKSDYKTMIDERYSNY